MLERLDEAGEPRRGSRRGQAELRVRAGRGPAPESSRVTPRVPLGG